MRFSFKVLILVFLSLPISCYYAQAQKSLYIDTIKGNLKAGTNVSVSMRTKGFSAIVGFQGTIKWDTTALQFSNLSYGTSSINLAAGDLNLNTNFLTFIWTDASLHPNYIPDTTIIFTLNYKVRTSINSGNALVTLSNSPTPLQIIDTTIATAISLYKLSSYSKNGFNYLSWSILPDNKVASYTIQRSINGTDFENIDVLSVLNNDFATNGYYADSVHILVQNIYYRLLIENTDGSYSYSNITKVQSTDRESIFSIFPNPVHDLLTIQLYSIISETGYLQVSDFDGKLVFQQRIKVHIGLNKFILNTSNFKKGNYIFLFTGINSVQRKFLKL